MDKLQIIHEDAHLIAVSKPAGQIVITGRGLNEGEPLRAQIHTFGSGRMGGDSLHGKTLELISEPPKDFAVILSRYHNQTVSESH